MKKRLLSLALLLCLLLTVLPLQAVAAYTPKYTASADALYELGLFQGRGTGADGKPVYDLQKGITRAESLVMLLRLLGEDEIATSKDWIHPFADMQGHWAANYAAYAHVQGYTSGTSSSTFSPNKAATANMYLTFLLRALGYNDRTGDFSYNTAYKKAAELGICPEGAYAGGGTFYRDDCVFTSCNALRTKMKGSEQTLLDVLVEKGTVDADAAQAFLQKDLQPEAAPTVSNEEARSELLKYWQTHCQAGAAKYAFADVTHDGVDELFALNSDMGEYGMLDIYTVKDGQVSKIHTGGNTIYNYSDVDHYYLYRENGKAYILRAGFNMHQGYCSDHYEIYHLTADGKEVILRQDSFGGYEGEAGQDELWDTYVSYRSQSDVILTLRDGSVWMGGDW